MIITRSPLRVSLGGGGTDLPSYYQEHEGFLIAAAIDRYVYVTVMRPFTEGIFLKYSQLEQVKQITEVEHPIIRECLRHLNFKTPQIEITTLADIPSGTGLGSSGSFTTALLKALYTHRKKHLHQEELAEMACNIELNKLNEPIGKQDQYIAALGGITCFTFQKDGKVIASPLDLSMETIHDLEDNLLLFFTGYSRSASGILKDQNDRSQKKDGEMIDNLNYVKDLGYQSKKYLESNNTIAFGMLMDEHWDHKKKRTSGMTNPQIDRWYQIAKDNGAIGGKLVGAGGGGFLMFMAKDRLLLRKAMTAAGLEEVRFKFDFEGTKIVMAS
jgi:D-glycero-alpha-D-manno-heptose-7-phosphate kinase